MNALRQIFREMGFDEQTVRLPEAGVIYALARTYSVVSRKLAGVYARVGLSAASFNLLMLLARGQHPDSFTQQALGKRLVVSASDMTGLVDRLERKQLVKRIPGKDRRSHFLRITPKGEALVDQAWPHHVDAVKGLAEVLTARERTVLLRALARLRATVEA